jgi:hypothetical protein
MLINGWNGDLKKLRHQLLRQPDALILIVCFNALFAGLPGEDQEFRRAVAELQFFLFAHGWFPKADR